MTKAHLKQKRKRLEKLGYNIRKGPDNWEVTFKETTLTAPTLKALIEVLEFSRDIKREASLQHCKQYNMTKRKYHEQEK